MEAGPQTLRRSIRRVSDRLDVFVVRRREATKPVTQRLRVVRRSAIVAEMHGLRRECNRCPGLFDDLHDAEQQPLLYLQKS